MGAPLAVFFLISTNPSRVSRLFWFWGIAYAILFLLAHPWAHMYQDQLPSLITLAQNAGVLLDQDKHMRHHQDLESQFTILSGHADVVIDTVSQILPPHRYDLWLFVFITWFMSPIYMDIFLSKGHGELRATAWARWSLAEARGCCRLTLNIF